MVEGLNEPGDFIRVDAFEFDFCAWRDSELLKIVHCLTSSDC
jgi:hypothetical protein